MSQLLTCSRARSRLTLESWRLASYIEFRCVQPSRWLHWLRWCDRFGKASRTFRYCRVDSGACQRDCSINRAIGVIISGYTLRAESFLIIRPTVSVRELSSGFLRLNTRKQRPNRCPCSSHHSLFVFVLTRLRTALRKYHLFPSFTMSASSYSNLHRHVLTQCWSVYFIVSL